MRGKVAKEIRKEARRRVDSSKKSQLIGQVPLAGCPHCEGHLWYVELDAHAPHHQYINFLICANPLCNGRLPMRFDINECPTMEEMDAIMNPPDPDTEDACEPSKMDAEGHESKNGYTE